MNADASPTPEPAAPRRLPRNVWLLGWASLLNDVASEMIAPLLPQFLIGVLGGNKFHLGIIEGVADSLSSVLKLWSGARSDRSAGRKQWVVTGYALAGLVRPLLRFALVPWHVFAVRLTDRLGKGLRTAPRDAMIVDSTDAAIRGRAFGFHRAMDHLGAALGPLAATALLWLWEPSDTDPAAASQALREMFLVTLLPGLLVAGLVLFGLREPRCHIPARRPFTLGLRTFPRSFQVYLASLLVFTLGNSSDLFLLVRAQELGVRFELLPSLWFAFHVVKSAGNVLGGWTVDRLGARPLLFVGWLWYAAVYLAFAFATAVWHVWALFLLYAVYYSLTEPSEKTLVVLLAGRERTGLAYGWYNLLMGVAALPASFVFGWVYQQLGAVYAFGMGSALALTAMLLLLAVRGPSE